MILLCDENLGKYIPDELNWRGFDVRSARSLGWLGLDDVVWIPGAGLIEDSLVLSRDREIIHNAEEKGAIIRNNVGIVCLTEANDPAELVVRLVEDNWALLERLHLFTPRPFARFLTSVGELLDEFNGVRL